MPDPRTRPWKVFTFLSLLIVPQAFAFVQQFRDGYRPFRAAPHRVAFSWDMFSVRIERCDLVWQPALKLPQGDLYRLHQRAAPVEWDFTLDRTGDYQQLAAWTCANFHQPFHASLVCFTPEGKVVPSVVDCR